MTDIAIEAKDLEAHGGGKDARKRRGRLASVRTGRSGRSGTWRGAREPIRPRRRHAGPSAGGDERRARRRPESATIARKKAEGEAAHAHIGAPLDRGRDELGPPPLERRPGHDAMRDGEQKQEQRIDEGRSDRTQGTRPRIDGFWDDEVPDEPDRVQEGGEEDEIARHAIGQGEDPAHCRLNTP